MEGEPRLSQSRQEAQMGALRGGSTSEGGGHACLAAAAASAAPCHFPRQPSSGRLCPSARPSLPLSRCLRPHPGVSQSTSPCALCPLFLSSRLPLAVSGWDMSVLGSPHLSLSFSLCLSMSLLVCISLSFHILLPVSVSFFVSISFSLFVSLSLCLFQSISLCVCPFLSVFPCLCLPCLQRSLLLSHVFS